MKDFNHTVGVLVKAYLDDVLEHGNCQACAVGNIVANSYGNFLAAAPCPSIGAKGHGWAAVFCTLGKDIHVIYEKEYTNLAKRQIDSTGYTWQELARIEKAFEANNGDYTGIKDGDTAMFNGLMAVVDVLADIHGIDLQQKEEAKALFVKH